MTKLQIVHQLLKSICKVCHSDGQCVLCRLRQFDRCLELIFDDGISVKNAVQTTQKEAEYYINQQQTKYDKTYKEI